MCKVNRRPNTKCTLCSKSIYRKPYQIKEQKGTFCSRACRNKVYTDQCKGENKKKGSRGESNPAWKGGVTFFKKKGNYKNVVYVRCPEWAISMARKDGYIMQHRLEMAMMCKRLLSRNEVVHHKDHNPANNERSNLELFPSNRIHKIMEYGKIVEGATNVYCPSIISLKIAN